VRKSIDERLERHLEYFVAVALKLGESASTNQTAVSPNERDRRLSKALVTRVTIAP